MIDATSREDESQAEACDPVAELPAIMSAILQPLF